MSLLAMDNIEKEYQNQKVLTGASLRVERGERVVLIGDNGSGKSTLLKIAMGLESADMGNVTVSRRTVTGYLSQELMELRDRDEVQTAGTPPGGGAAGKRDAPDGIEAGGGRPGRDGRAYEGIRASPRRL